MNYLSAPLLTPLSRTLGSCVGVVTVDGLLLELTSSATIGLVGFKGVLALITRCWSHPDKATNNTIKSTRRLLREAIVLGRALV